MEFSIVAEHKGPIEIQVVSDCKIVIDEFDLKEMRMFMSSLDFQSNFLILHYWCDWK